MPFIHTVNTYPFTEDIKQSQQRAVFNKRISVYQLANFCEYVALIKSIQKDPLTIVLHVAISFQSTL